MGEKNKTCATKTLFTNFTASYGDGTRSKVVGESTCTRIDLYANRLVCNCFLQVWKNLFIVLKIRSHAKLTCIFVNCGENKKIFACCFPLRLFSRSLPSVVES